jgi:hypothetical protein
MDLGMLILALALPAAVAGIVLGALLLVYHERRRRSEIAAWARTHGWSYSPEIAPPPDGGLPALDDQASIWTRDHAVRAVDSRRADLGRVIVDLFVFQCVDTPRERAGRPPEAALRRVMLCATLDLPCDFGRVAIRRHDDRSRNLVDRELPIVWTGDEVFDRRFEVRAATPRAALDLLTEEVRACLLEDPRWALRTDDGLMLIFDEGASGSATEYEELARQACRLLEALPGAPDEQPVAVEFMEELEPFTTAKPRTEDRPLVSA